MTKKEMAILESCEVVYADEEAAKGRYTVRLAGGQPVRLITPEGQEGPVARIPYPLSPDARRDLPGQAAHVLMDTPGLQGFVAVDEAGEVQGVVPAERLRRLIVQATGIQAEEAREQVATELGLEEEAVATVLEALGSLRGLLDYVPGPPGPPLPPVTVYVCPEEGCDFMFIPHQEGQPIPLCPTHGQLLVVKKLGG
jgi:hypothetical protein